MKRSLSLVRDALLGRRLPETPAGQMNMALARQCPPSDAAILLSFNDREWDEMRGWCKSNCMLWNGEDIAAPVDLLPSVAKAISP